MSAIIDSPVWGAAVTVGGAAVTGLITMIARLITKVNNLDGKIDGIAADVLEIKQDGDTVRWSELAKRKQRGRRRVI